MKKQIKYSIVIPAFNEAAFIGSTLDSLYQYLRKTKKLNETEVIVVVADSPDKSSIIVNSKKRLFRHFSLIEPGRKVGKGRDVQAGIFSANGCYVLFTDADLATPLHHIADVWHQLERNYEVVIGVRDLVKINNKFHRGFGKLVSICGSFLSRLLIAPDIKDTQCGFKGFKKEAAAAIFSNLTIKGWAFDMEVVAIAQQRQFKIAKLNIDDWQENKPKVLQLSGENRLLASFKSFISIVWIKFNIISNRYAEKGTAVNDLPYAYPEGHPEYPV